MNESPFDLEWDDISRFLIHWFDEDPLQEPERSVFRDYYASYLKNFSPYMKHHFAEQTREICSEIRKMKQPRLLEVGSGCGTESLWFALLGARVTSIDLRRDRLAVAQARKDWLEQKLGRVLDVQFVEASIFDFHSDKSFDLIWMEQAYHHIEPRGQLASKLFSLAGRGGKCFICEANAWNPLLQAQMFKLRGWRTKASFVDDAGKTHSYGNERITTPFALRRALRRAGFMAVQSRNFRVLPNSNPPHWWLATELAILSVAPAISTHFNVVGTRP